jgi:Golgi nucleoside diphosphatase
MRRQVKAALIFNGHTVESIEEIDEETFNDICVMYGDGVLGGKATYNAIAPLTTAVFNYIRQPTTPAYTADSIFPWINEYDKNPEFEPTEQEKVNNALITYITSAPQFSLKRFKDGK